MAPPGYLPTITPPAELSGVTWKPLDASQAAESLRSPRLAVEFSPAHPITASIRAEAMCPPGISGWERRSLRSWLIVECRCGSRRATQKQELRKAVQRSQNLYCSPACLAEGLGQANRTRFCACGTPIPRNRAKTCSPACTVAQRNHPTRTCPQCATEFRPRSSRTTYCSRACANAGHSARMIGRGNSHYKTGTSYARWFRSMRPLILERDGHRCVACSEAPTMAYARKGWPVTRSALVIHHINEDVTNNLPENLITLCQACHMTHHKSRQTPFPWFATEATRRSTSMTSRWRARTTSLATAYSSTTA